ncbi:OmpH family outer membrane protein [Algicella marina]|uniref:OmpH family outer membrane protein n=1 Tax=Algicella marina TaxID=2683284 RepID=A0A6P1SW95_9RHOB|nr:OmpH family outer membrane protein [Algicella marina]QHQ34718.1 OmpH family outer membrane protein [Algicella marina]
MIRASDLRAGLTALLVALAGPAAAQDEPPPAFLVIEQERLLTDSAAGQAVLAEEEADRNALLEEGRALDAQFEAEEQALTEQRATMDAAAFRELADAFDEKVVATRRDQEQKAANLNRRAEERRREFLQQVQPILLEVLEASGATAVVDRRLVLIFKQELNITSEVIRRLDETLDAVPDGEIPVPDETEN